MSVSINKPTIISLPQMRSGRGNLSFIEGGCHVPFSIRRVYWVYDLPGGQTRGGHAFRTQHEFIVALSGSFTVVVSVGGREYSYHLDRAYFGLYIPPHVWRSLSGFSTNSVAMVMSSTAFDESDYIRDYQEYLAGVEDGQGNCI